MAKPPLSDHNTTADHINYQTWILRVLIHCDGCKKKVFKVLHSVEGVYKTVIDAEQHKVMVTGVVDGDTLVQKLLKSGKHAEILPESFKPTAVSVTSNVPGKSKKKKKQSKKLNVDDEEIGDNEKVVEHSGILMADVNDSGTNQVQAQPSDGGGGGAGGKKKKKNKGKGHNNTTPPPNGGVEGVTTEAPPADTRSGSVPVTAAMVELNRSPPVVSTAPYDQPPYQSYYPTPVYGVSYNTSYPSTESSYHAPPVYRYTLSYPSASYPPPPPPPSNPISAFDDDDDDYDDGRGCYIM